MAEFYKPLSEGSPDFTSSSKGYKANNVFGDIAAGAGDLIKMGTTAVDQYFKGTIKEESDTAAKDLFSQYGNDAAVATSTGINSVNTPSIAAIDQGAKQLAMLKQAVSNGTLKDSSFWAQAELISRQLKMRYPGYWEDVDKSMAEATGRKPAIALHSELMQEAASGKSKEEAARVRAIEDAKTAGLVGVLAVEGTDKQYTTNQINTMVASRNAIKWDQENRGRQYNLAKEEKSLTENKVYEAASRDSMAETTALLQDTTSPFAKNVGEMRTLMNRINEDTKSGNATSPENVAKATALKAQIDRATNDIYLKYLQKYGADADPEKLKKHLQPIKDWADTFTEGIQSGKSGLVENNAAFLKSMEDADLYKFYQDNNAVRKGNTVRRALGEQANLYFTTASQGQKWLTDRDISIVNYLESVTMTEGKSIVDTTDQMAKLGVKDPKTFDQHVTRTMNAIVSDDVPVDLKVNSINSLYGTGNSDFLQKRVPEKERVPMFLKMSAPVMMKTIKDLKDQNLISDTDFDKHVGWVTRNAIQLLSDLSPDVNAMNTQNKKSTLYFDFSSGRFVPGTDKNYKPDVQTGLGKIVAQIPENLANDASTRAVTEANKILGRMETMATTLGTNEQKNFPKTAKLLLEQAGIPVVNWNEEDPKKNRTATESMVRFVEDAGSPSTIWQGLGKLGDPSLNYTKEDTQGGVGPNPFQ